jgi:transcriptional regulator with XRE-family HTH domain
MRKKSLLVKFGNQVKEIRESIGLSQEELAELCGLHRTYIGSVERGERNLSLVNISKISKALNIDSSKLLEGVDD